MTKGDVYNLISGVSEFLAPVSPGPIQLMPGLRAGSGDVQLDPYLGPRFNIGVQDLENNKDELTDEQAMVYFMVPFHEVCGHGGQIKYEFEKKTDLSKILALNYYACEGSGEYCDGNAALGVFSKQYKNQPHEIAAQYMCLKSARSYMPRIFGKERTDELLLKYVNYRVSLGSEFIESRKPYTDMDDVLKAFDKAFYRSCDRHREYDPDRDKYDSVHACLKTKDNGTKQVARCRSGLQQDFMMAAAFRAVHPSHDRFFARPVFEDMGCVVGNAFSKRPKWERPKAVKSQADRLTDMVAERDAVKEDIGKARDGPGKYD